MPVTEPEFCPHSRKVVLNEWTDEQNKKKISLNIGFSNKLAEKNKMPREKKCVVPVIIHKKDEI